MKEMIKGLLLGFFIITGLVGLLMLMVGHLEKVVKEKGERDSKSANVIYKCINGSLWKLSDDRSYFSPAPLAYQKCIPNDDKK